MTQTHLVSKGFGTRCIQAESAVDALDIARTYLGAGDWQYVGLDQAPAPYAPPVYSAEVERAQLGRDTLDEGE